MADRPARGRQRPTFVVALAFSGYVFGYACTYAATSTTFILPLTRQFGWGRLIPSLMYVAAMFGVVVASFALGRIIERFGEARVAAASGVLLAGVIAASSAMSGSTATAVVFAFLAGLLGAGTGSGMWVAIVPKWIDQGLGRALGIAVLGQSAGSVLMPAISAQLMEHGGWREAYRGLAAITLVGTILIAWLLSRLAGAHRGQQRAAASAERGGMSPGNALRQRSFWLLALAILLQALGMFGVSFHIYPIYHDLGIGWADLPRVTATLGVGLALGRFASGMLLDHLEPRLVAAGIFAVGAVADAWLAFQHGTPSGVVLYLPPLLVGAAMGSESDIIAYMARQLFGLRHYAVIYNRLLVGFFIGAMLGPLLLGWAFDHLADPRLGLWALASSCAVATLIAATLPRVRHLVHSSAVI